MIDDVAAEVFLFQSRRQLVQLQLHSRWLRDTIDRLCPKYPLHPLHYANLRLKRVERLGSVYTVVTERWDGGEFTDFSDALEVFKNVLRHCYARSIHIDTSVASVIWDLARAEWDRILAALAEAVADKVFFGYVKLHSVSSDGLTRLATCRNLQGIEFTHCDLSSFSVDDEFLQECVQSGIHSLRFHDGDLPASTVTENAILDYCFPPAGNATDVALCFGMGRWIAHGENPWQIRLSASFKQRFLERWLAVGSDRRIVCEINGIRGSFNFRAPSFTKAPYFLKG